MAVLQPLYISQGRYTPGIDRKLLTGIFDTTSAGALMTGVLPPTDHFKASASGVTVTVSPGFCVIPDSPSQNSDSPGVYFCSVDAVGEVATAATTGIALSTPGTYKIYAEVNETTKSVTKAEIASTNVAKLTTSTAHGYSVGQTVLVNGINDSYNGSYVITAVTTSAPFTFSFAKTGTVGSPATVDPATGTSSVPFAIKYATAYPTAGTANYIPIATAVSTGSAITLTDEREFVSGRSGIQLFRSTAANGSITTAAEGVGRLSYDLDTNKLYAYVNGAPKLVVDGTTGHHDTVATGGSADAIHHKIGTGAYDAAAGNHTHASRVLTPQSAYDGSMAQGSLSQSSASPTQITGAYVTITLPTTPDEQWVLISGTVTIRSTAVSGANTNFCRIGIETDGPGTTDDDAFTGASTITAVNGVETTQCVPFTRLVKFSVAGAHTINLKAYRDNANSVFEINQFYLTAVPVNYV